MNKNHSAERSDFGEFTPPESRGLASAGSPGAGDWEVLGNLGRMAAAGLLVPGSVEARRVEDGLVDREGILRSGVHPLSVLLADRAYAAGGETVRGGPWVPVPSVLEALEKTFHVALGNVEPVGRPVLVAVDLSRSMQAGRVEGLRLSFAEAAVAMARVMVSADPGSVVVGFTGAGSVDSGRVSWLGGTGLTLLEVSPGMRLTEVMQRLPHLPFGRVDPAFPMTWALRHRLDVGGFVILTHHEAPAGEVSPGTALASYRAGRVESARCVVIRMSRGGGAPPRAVEPGVLEVSGFDALVPRVVSRFLREGEVETRSE
jgi:60 kDa SS-A/Ro ribonucleoprotein